MSKDQLKEIEENISEERLADYTKEKMIPIVIPALDMLSEAIADYYNKHGYSEYHLTMDNENDELVFNFKFKVSKKVLKEVHNE